MSDDGLPAATQRVKVASDKAHVVRDFDGPRVTCRCGATLRTDDGTWYDHRLEEFARAAREDVAETVREAREKAYDHGWAAANSESAIYCSRSKGCTSKIPGNPYAIRAGEQ